MKQIPPQVRSRVLASGPCVYCGDPSEVVDHVIPRQQGGTNDPENLAPACRWCNGQKGARTPEQWRAAAPMWPPPTAAMRAASGEVLAPQLLATAQEERESRAERDRLIVEAHQQGYPLREIAAWAGLSNPSVLHIIRRDE